MKRQAAMVLTTLIFTGLMATGCATPPSISLPSGLSTGADTQILTGTSVSLSKNNFEVVKSNAIGESWGINLLGLIPVKSPYYTEAITRVYRRAGVMVGKPRALANVVHERTSNFYLLFSIPRITVRADVVEFKAEEEKPET